jgi:hypothetical protein
MLFFIAKFLLFISQTIQASLLAPKQSHLTSRSTIVLPRDQNSSGMRLMFLKMAMNSQSLHLICTQMNRADFYYEFENVGEKVTQLGH